MTELQAVEKDILMSFIDICNRLGLTYYLVCGTALGAVKYGGFIPWDDDVDVGIPREEYEVFLEKAPELLPPHLFLQHYRSDPSFPTIYAKIRNSETTYIEKSVAHLPMNHGVYIDVFPLDGYPSDPLEQQKLEKIKLSCQKKLSCVFSLKRSPKEKMGYVFRRFLGYHRRTANILDTYTAAISKYNTEHSEILCNHGNWQGKLEYAPREQYGNGSIMRFEGLEVRVPEKYDEYLTQKYGDWRSDLPENKKVGHHYYDVLDLTKSYTDYIKI